MLFASWMKDDVATKIYWKSNTQKGNMKMINYAEEFRADLAEFREITKKFYNGELSVGEYKGFSGGFGSYAQRGGKAGMLRLRLTGGCVSKEYLDFIAKSVEKYKVSRIHLTTCQSIQLHDLDADTICTLIEEAWDHGIITRGGGGDFPRNTMMSPLSGVEKDEYFDLTPYAKAAGDYLLSLIKSVKLPRKLKVCFSNSPKNSPHATFRDLGFVATPEKKFDVYSAGGLGNNPKHGVKVASDVEPSKILYYIEAMKDTFVAYGNYENRAKARTRYMQETLGVDGYIKAFNEKLAIVMETKDLDLSIESEKASLKTSTEELVHERAIAQKQTGLYAVYYHPLGGNILPEKLVQINNAIANMEDVSIRIDPAEAMYFINCTASEAKELIALTDDGARTVFETSVACIGNKICQVGARDSQELLKECIDAVRPHDFANGVLPKIHISGCPSSCSAHQIGTLGFRGAAKKSEDGMQAAFMLTENGCEVQGKERFGDELGVMFQSDIPTFLVEVGKAVTAAHTTFEEWSATSHDDFLAIVNKYV